MNEKIKQLAEQAALNAVTKNFNGTSVEVQVPSENWAKEFAELIVKECIAITDELVNRNVDGSWTSNELYTDYNGALFEVKRRIQESFGVEE